MIGNDDYLDFVNSDKIEVQEGLYLLSSKFRWILSGSVKHTFGDSNDTHMLILTYGSESNKNIAFPTLDSAVRPKAELEDFCNIESIWIVDRLSKEDDDLVMEKFKETIKIEYGRYQVKWPWKSVSPDLALGRLRSRVNRMKTNIMLKYNSVNQDQLQKGIIERVERNKPDGTVHYRAHHGVLTPQKTSTKLRVVNDGSAKTSKVNNSLNDCLYRVLVMFRDLCGILLRFRTHPIALIAGIEKGFLQIGLHRDKRDVTRFL